MSDQFLGEIRAFAGVYPPNGWALCDGSLVSIGKNSALFAIIGTKFGGDGTTNFALPDLVGHAAMGVGMAPGLNNSLLGEEFGSDTVALAVQNMPAHNHTLQRQGHGTGSKTNTPASDSYVGQLVITQPGQPVRLAESYVTNAKPDTTLDAGMVGYVGSGQPHENRQPFLKLIYCIAVAGAYPSH